ncbi:unnamed protein product [Didymodactylos carnosus]|nr:unnamed protein product [Didymodactylos carnosus]CAF4262507.1 unnamed protein product [Didymodactylos carnosus]
MGTSAATPDVVRGLLAAVRDKEYSVRKYAIEAIGKMDGNAVMPDVINGLLAALRDKEDFVSANAAEALGKLRTNAVTPDVINGLLVAHGDEHDDVRLRAAQILGKMGTEAVTPDVIKVLVVALGDQELVVRCRAEEALGKMGTEVVTPDVINGLLAVLDDAINGAAVYSAASMLFSRSMLQHLSADAACRLVEMRLLIPLDCVKPMELIRMFFQTQINVWLPLIFWAAFREDSAITVTTQSIRQFHSDRVEDLDLSNTDGDKLRIAICLVFAEEARRLRLPCLPHDSYVSETNL